MAFYNWQYFFFFLSFLVIPNMMLSLDLTKITVFHFLPQHILEGLRVVSRCIVQLVSLRPNVETISTHLCLLKEYVCYSLLPG